ncbi:hypothetical protein [Romboutsia sp. 1001713B170207_170306_H8]|nr:hypothetical protein [Romboutsia sp. 1001713B170207_170306_H8]
MECIDVDELYELIKNFNSRECKPKCIESCPLFEICEDLCELSKELGGE